MVRSVRAMASAALMILAVSGASAWGCKYSVRDVGFVDLDSQSYRLAIIFDEPTAGPGRALIREAREILADCNVTVSEVDLSHPSKSYLLARLPRIDPISLPAAWVIPATGSAAPLEVPRGEEDRVDAQEFRVPLGNLVASPARRVLRELLPEALCVILLLEGTDAASNQAAQDLAETVGEQIRQVLPRLDKPTKQGALQYTLPLGHRERERWFLWSLGEPLTAPPQARLVVFFGRMRPTGNVRDAAEEDARSLFAKVATLGQSSERGLDRQSVYGRSVLHRWAAGHRRTLAETLTFDPEEPLVRAEINALLAKPVPTAPQRRTVAPMLTFEELMHGHKEIPRDDESAPRSVAPTISSDNPTMTEQMAPADLAKPTFTTPDPSTDRTPGWENDHGVVNTITIALATVMAVAFLAVLWALLRARMGRF